MTTPYGENPRRAARRYYLEAQQWRSMALSLSEEVRACETEGLLPPAALERLQPLLELINSQPPSSPSDPGVE